MSIRISRLTEAKEILGQRSVARLFLMLAVGFSLGSDHATLQAQDPAQGPQSNQAASAPAPPAAATLPTAPTGEYLINPEDVLDVYVYDVPELSREFVVSAVGTITVPLLPKPLQAAGLSPEQLARSLEAEFRQKGRLSRPQITVAVKQSRRSLVTVEGAVKSPQAVPLIGRSRLIAVLSQCGGRADDAGSTITVTRGELALHDLGLEGASTSPTATVEFKNLVDVNDPMSKFDVWPGDRVSVERAGLFYVLGQVNRPGGYNLKSAQEQLTVLQALAIAGDFTPIAKSDQAMIIRKNPTAPNGRIEIALNVKDIIYGRSPDSVLQANDILYVPVSGSKKAMRTAAVIGTTMVSAVGTAAIYTRF